MLTSRPWQQSTAQIWEGNYFSLSLNGIQPLSVIPKLRVLIDSCWQLLLCQGPEVLSSTFSEAPWGHHLSTRVSQRRTARLALHGAHCWRLGVSARTGGRNRTGWEGRGRMSYYHLENRNRTYFILLGYWSLSLPVSKSESTLFTVI